MKKLTVLLPLDGSEGSQLAIDTAKELLDKFEIHFKLLNVLDIRTKLTGYEEFDKLLNDRKTKASEEILSRAKEQLAGCEVTTDMDIGRPGERIVAYIAKHPVDLIIMATQNQSRVQRLLLGSVTNYVLSYSSKPVLVIPMKMPNHT